MTVYYRNTKTGKVVERDTPDPQLEPAKRWVRVEDDAPDHLPDGAGLFDPSVHGVREVRSYLADATEAERKRVLTVEAGGKARMSLIGREAGDGVPSAEHDAGSVAGEHDT